MQKTTVPTRQDATEWLLDEAFWTTRQARNFLSVARCRYGAARPRSPRARTPRARRVQRSSARSGDSGDGDPEPSPHDDRAGAQS